MVKKFLNIGETTMLYAHVSPDDLKQLETELTSVTDAKWYRRLKVIHLSAQQQPVSVLATFFDLCPATVREYITRYNTDGLGGLARDTSPGAPQKIPLTKADWEALLHQSPAQFARLQTGARNWTQTLVVRYLQEYHQGRTTQPALSKFLRRLGIRWNRGKLTVTSPDPEYTVKRERIDTLNKSRGWHVEQP